MFWVFIVALCILLWGVVTKGANMGSKDTDISYSDLLNQVKQGKVLDAEVQGGELHGHMKATPKVQFHTYVGEHYESLEKAFTDADPTQTRFNKKPEQSNIIPLVTGQWPADPADRGGFLLLHAPDAVGRQQGALFRQEPRAPALVCSRRRSPSRTWLAWMRPRKS